MTPQRPAGPRILQSRERSEIAALLRDHGLDGEYVTELLDYAELHGDAQSAWVRVALDGGTWTVDLFAPRREAA